MEYGIKVQGKLDPGWSEWFAGMTLADERTPQGAITTLSGPVPDQSALRSILNALWDLNLTLVSVIRTEAQAK
ncbi:MAG: hypothetical protein PVI63_05840 [Anaerolineae bacterium]|jgi:hypothetical protein